MPDRVYAAEPSDCYRVVDLDALSAIYHKTSALTHMVTEPVPQVLGVLCGKSMRIDQIVDALKGQFDLADDPEIAAVLAARLDEMAEVGLVSPA